jgi:hypothetical protein
MIPTFFSTSSHAHHYPCLAHGVGDAINRRVPLEAWSTSVLPNESSHGPLTWRPTRPISRCIALMEPWSLLLYFISNMKAFL